MADPKKKKPFNTESFMKGIAFVESGGGKYMLNPSSSATGLYGHLYNDIPKDFLKKHNIDSRDAFASDTSVQNALMRMRIEGDMSKFPRKTNLLTDVLDLEKEYKPQLGEKYNLRSDELAVLSHFLGRQGARYYLAGIRDNKPYKPKGMNKTPEEYLELYNQGLENETAMKSKYQTGGSVEIDSFLELASMVNEQLANITDTSHAAATSRLQRQLEDYRTDPGTIMRKQSGLDLTASMAKGGLKSGGIGAGTALISHLAGRKNRIEEREEATKDWSQFWGTRSAQNLAGSGYKKGGKIQGGGSGKSDSVDMDAPEGSFIVPAENSSAAMSYGKDYLGWDDEQVAKRNYGNIDIDVSNGEVFFTPDEYQALTYYGVDVDALAPDAEKNQTGFCRGGRAKRKASGGPVYDKHPSAAKAREMLKNPPHDNPLTEDQKRYFQALAHGWEPGKKYQYGGEIGSFTGLSPVDKLRLQYLGHLPEDITAKTSATPAVPTMTYPSDPNNPLLAEQAGPRSPELTPEPTNTWEDSKYNKALKNEFGKLSPEEQQEFINERLVENGLDTSTPGVSFGEGEDEGSNFKKIMNNLGEIAGFAQIAGGTAGLIAGKRRPDVNVSQTLKSLFAEAHRKAGYGLPPAVKNEMKKSAARGLREVENVITGKGGSAQEVNNRIASALANYIRETGQTELADYQAKENKFAQLKDLAIPIGAQEFDIQKIGLRNWEADRDLWANLLGAGVENIIGARQYKNELEILRKINEGRNTVLNFNYPTNA